MIKKLLFVALLALIGLQINAQERDRAAKTPEKISVDKALFMQGDDKNWANPEFDDSSWKEFSITKYWNEQGLPYCADSYAWYRIHVISPRISWNPRANRML